MADHPFSNSGLGMYGSAERQFSQAAMQGGDKNGILGKILGSALEASGIKDYLDSLGSDSSSSTASSTKASITPSYGVAPSYSVAPPVPVSPEGINPMRLSNTIPGGVGLNAQPTGAINPFQFQVNPKPTASPDDEHRNQIKSAWS